MVALIISLLVEQVKSGLPNKSILTTELSLSVKILALILFSFFKSICLSVVKVAQWKWAVHCISFPQLHKGSIESWKLCLNLCSFKWLKLILRHVRNFIPDELFMLKILLAFGLMKFNKCFLTISKDAELRISRSSLLHSLITDGKKNFWNYVYPRRYYVIWVSSSVQSTILSIKLNKWGGNMFLSIFKKGIVF